MKNLTFVLLGALLMTSTVACGEVAKTSSTAPNSTDATANTAANTADKSAVNKSTAQANQDDATSETRRRQLNSDIRAREQRSGADGNPMSKADGDIASQVRSKLEANLPASALTIAAKDGAVTVTGSVTNEAQIQKIEPLAKQIDGVRSVNIKVVTSMAMPNAPSPGSSSPIQEHTGTKK